MLPDASGTLWPLCWACNNTFRRSTRGVVPISFSTSQGLTSVIAQAKEEPDRWWIRVGLASLLYTFMNEHRTCLERLAYGTFDYVTVVPSHPSKRAGRDHLKDLQRSVAPEAWDAWPWDLDLLLKMHPSGADDRRGAIDKTLFQTSGVHNLAGRRVLLVDDLYTSGGTIASAAAALTAAGADPPVVLTIGRHLQATDAAVRAFIEASEAIGRRGFERTTCAVHVDDTPWVDYF
jgi:predicted amidophosphoribosyltransferase